MMGLNWEPRMRLSLVSILAFLILSSFGRGQTLVGAEPFPLSGDAYICNRDNVSENVLRLVDLNLDGDFNDAGEVIEVYNGLTGAYLLSNAGAIGVGPNGTVFVGDATTDHILALNDQNGDGDAMDALEATQWFNGNVGGNASGIVMSSIQALCVDTTGVVWVANANASSSGVDGIIRLEDLGGTPGANDPGEAVQYAIFAGSGVPSQIFIGPGGFLYYVETVGASGLPRGIHRLHDDVIPNGNCLDSGEVTPWYTYPLTNGSLYSAAFDRNGVVYVGDFLNDRIMALIDANAGFQIANGTAEEVQYWTSGGAASTIWGISGVEDGSLWVIDDAVPPRMLRIADDVVPNGVATDPGETTTLYNSTVSPFLIDDPFALAVARRPTLSGPALPSISIPFQIGLEATANDFFELFISTGVNSIVLAPYGTLVLSLAPPDVFLPLIGGSLGNNGQFVLPVPALNVPSLVGTTLYLQGYCGPAARIVFTNPLALPFQP